MSNSSKTINMSIRIDKEIKKEADELFRELGLNMSTAINMFLRQSIREQSIPFEAKLDTRSARLAEALKESDDIISGKIKAKEYDDFESLLEDLESEI